MVGIRVQGALEQLDRQVEVPLVLVTGQVSATLEIELVGVRGRRARYGHGRPVARLDGKPQDPGQAEHDAVLQGRRVGQTGLVDDRAELPEALGVNQVGGDLDAVAGGLDAAGDREIDAEHPPRLARARDIPRPDLAHRDDVNRGLGPALKARQAAGQGLDETFAERLPPRIIVDVGRRKHGDIHPIRQAGLESDPALEEEPATQDGDGQDAEHDEHVPPVDPLHPMGPDARLGGGRPGRVPSVRGRFLPGPGQQGGERQADHQEEQGDLEDPLRQDGTFDQHGGAVDRQPGHGDVGEHDVDDAPRGQLLDQAPEATGAHERGSGLTAGG